MTLDIDPGPPPIVQDWIRVDPVGFHLEREIGGMKIAPAILFDSLPIVSKLQSKSDHEPAGPTDSRVNFPRPYLVTTFSPGDVSRSQTEITIRASVLLATRVTAETDGEKSARTGLRQSLNDAAPTATCNAKEKLELTGGGTKILDLYKELAYIGQSLNNQVHVAQSILDAAKDLDPRDTPENLKKLGGAVSQAVGGDAESIWDSLKPPPLPGLGGGGGGGGATIPGTGIPIPAPPLPSIHF
jgi:hypothetical protein